MPAKLTLVEFAEMLADHKTKDLIEMLYLRMSEDDLAEMAADKDIEECAICSEPAIMGHDGDAMCRRCYEDNSSEECVECGEVVGDEEGWRDSKLKLFCDDCKEEADNYDPHEGIVTHEQCPGDEADYDFVECCDRRCVFAGHYVKKTEADKTDGRTDGDDEERKWAACMASYFAKSESLSS